MNDNVALYLLDVYIKTVPFNFKGGERVRSTVYRSKLQITESRLFYVQCSLQHHQCCKTEHRHSLEEHFKYELEHGQVQQLHDTSSE